MTNSYTSLVMIMSPLVGTQQFRTGLDKNSSSKNAIRWETIVNNVMLKGFVAV